MQAERLERVAQEQQHTLGYVAVAGLGLVDPVADVGRLEWAPLHAAQAHLTEQATVVEEHPEAVGGVEVALAIPRVAASPERLAVDRGVGRAGIAARLPLFQPTAAADADLPPRRPVARLERTQHDARADQLGMLGAPGHETKIT